MKPIPTISELASNMANDFKNKLNLPSNFLKKVLTAITNVLSAQTHLLYLYLSDVQNNIFPDTATTLENGGTLERQGMIYLNRPIFPDSIGVFKATIVGVAGSVLRANLTFKSNEGSLNPGQMFVLDSEYTCIGTADEIEIRSLGAGVDFNLLVNDNLTITEPIIGVNKTITISSIEEQPKAGESIEAYRQAILNAIQLEPQGGSRADYRQWATDAQGVRLIYPYVRDINAGIMDIYVEATLVDSINNDGIPTTVILEEVEEVLNYDPDVSKEDYERGRKPMQSILDVKSITRVPVDVDIIGLSDSSQSVQDAIKSSLEDMLYDVRPFISGADLRRNKNDILYYGKMQSIITESLTNGNFFNELVMKVDGNSEVSYEFDLGNVPYLDNLNFL
jgi:uncharacterized phage protein gp47/JayE